MAHHLQEAPVLSTPDTHILTEIDPVDSRRSTTSLSEQQFKIRYEIQRTIDEIKAQKWKRIALQFPDHMLPDSSRVYELLSRGVSPTQAESNENSNSMRPVREQLNLSDLSSMPTLSNKDVRLTILADTSYGACCVDEIAAEHVDAEAVIHYGRACLSPTARLPVLHIFTKVEIDQNAAILAFVEAFPDRSSKVIITADIPYASCVSSIANGLAIRGYENLFAADILHNPASIIPNRTVPESVSYDAAKLAEWHLFHVAEPPTALLLTMSSKVQSVLIYDPDVPDGQESRSQEANTTALLRRRYALVTSMNTVSTWGILINTLSVKNYLNVVDCVKKQIAAAGKKAYLFVVGKLNAAKVANFSEIGGWVVVGCWESSLIDSRDFFRPILTPFELELAIASDENRLWTGAWRSDFATVLENNNKVLSTIPDQPAGNEVDASAEYDNGSEEDSAPPEFDLRTGRYVSQTRPMARYQPSAHDIEPVPKTTSNALTRQVGDKLIAVNGIASPAAEFLAQKRTWKGLGSDFEIQYDDEEVEGEAIEEGRSGMARGYTVGASSRS